MMKGEQSLNTSKFKKIFFQTYILFGRPLALKDISSPNTINIDEGSMI